MPVRSHPLEACASPLRHPEVPKRRTGEPSPQPAEELGHVDAQLRLVEAPLARVAEPPALVASLLGDWGFPPKTRKRDA
jgi:hypothetical protein